jgi:hypothetical protein
LVLIIVIVCIQATELQYTLSDLIALSAVFASGSAASATARRHQRAE